MHWTTPDKSILSITDVYDQYEYFARQMDRLPDHMTPIILPGNHDAVRPAEPQPVLETSVQNKFNNAIHVGNPSRVNLSGIDVLSYHGKGIDDMVPRTHTMSEIHLLIWAKRYTHVTYENPAEAMKEMLRNRHFLCGVSEMPCLLKRQTKW